MITHFEKLCKIASLILSGILIFSCQKREVVKHESFSQPSPEASSATIIPEGAKYERFDRLPMDLEWEHQYKTGTSAYSISTDRPKSGAGSAKFILHPDVYLSQKNRTNLNYFPKDSLGVETT